MIRRIAQRASLLLGCVAIVALLMIRLYCRAPSPQQVNGPQALEPRKWPWHDEPLELASSFFPDGEWWARSGSWVAVLSIAAGSGKIAVSQRGRETVGPVQLVGPSELFVSYGEDASTWHIAMPEDLPAGAYGSDLADADDVLDRFVVLRVRGTLGAADAPFILSRSEVHDPLLRCRDKMSVITRLRRLLQ